ncbi:polysaccharide export protein (plasmid) [Agrobacterium leguminum]|uniref:polysaccharide biosynthesis/export family protein n=1 Tax=Agrobacterium leguminum TaxID=2792015 RepID=UPI00272BE1E1|nr:polysaccharide biosynthesis/export family protein [Agrobacterium leguminum]WLE00540.1 polysaccharide export protein [Agrobacterium leguminum]
MMHLRNVVLILAFCLLAASVSGCSTGGTPELSTKQGERSTDNLRLVQSLPPPENSGDGVEQPLMPGDVLNIDVFQADQLSRTTQIDARGRISLPLVGTVTAAGKTQRDFEQELRDLYGARYLQNPQITVFLKESVGQRVTVDGQVTRAGLFPVSANTTLMDAIALAGGLRELADEKKVYVYRSIGTQKLVANYNVASIRDGRIPNPRIYGGDVVMVFTSQSRVATNNLKEALGLSARVAAGFAVLP